jgi:hypothetical protein
MTSYLPVMSYVIVGTSAVAWMCLLGGGWLGVQRMSVSEGVIAVVMACRMSNMQMQ